MPTCRWCRATPSSGPRAPCASSPEPARLRSCLSARGGRDANVRFSPAVTWARRLLHTGGMCRLLLLLIACTRNVDHPTHADGGACASSVTPSPGLVASEYGPVQGMSESGTWAFRGVPFAAPPVGDLR